MQLFMSNRFGYMLTALTLDVGIGCVVLSMGVTHGISYGMVYASTIGGVLKVLIKK